MWKQSQRCSVQKTEVDNRVKGRQHRRIGNHRHCSVWINNSKKMGTTKLVYQISTALVIVLFTFAGLVKVVPGISPELHDEMVSISERSICANQTNTMG